MDTYRLYVENADGIKKYLNLHGSDVTAQTISNGQNVTVWELDSSSNEQKWGIDNFGECPILSAIHNGYSLNINTETNNCDIWLMSNNGANDYTVSFESTGDGAFYIEMEAHDLYLTAGGFSNGDNVSWEIYRGNNRQKWKIETVSDVPVNPIDKWSWSTVAYNALNNRGPVTAVTRQEWNSLCDKVQECLTRAGETWYTYHGPNGEYTPTYANAKMSASDKTLTASRFNAVRGNVGSHVSTGIDPVSPGDPVLAADFITIGKSLNSWIDDLNS